jgi:ribonuclease Z
VITECTFFDPEHRDRAKVGKHLHIEDLRNLIQAWKKPTIVVVHVSRRTNMQYARERIAEAAGEHASRVHLLMDHRVNRQRYERQVAENPATERASAGE